MYLPASRSVFEKFLRFSTNGIFKKLNNLNRSVFVFSRIFIQGTDVLR